MSLLTDVKDRVQRACGWLNSVQENGAYGAESGVTYHTAEAAHLCAWMFKAAPAVGMEPDPFRRSARAAANHLARTFRESGNVLPCAIGSPVMRFIDLGLAGRALFAVHRACGQTEYWDLSIALAAQMMRFAAAMPSVLDGAEMLVDSDNFGRYDALRALNWMPMDSGEDVLNNPGPYQLKPAMNLKVNHRLAAFDDIATRYHSGPRIGSPKRLKGARLQQWGDEVFSFCWWLDALAMAEHSYERAVAGLALLERILDSDVPSAWCLHFASRLRLKMMLGVAQTPVRLAQRVLDFQQDSGAFCATLTGGVPGEPCITSTVAAIQALVMVAEPKLSVFPGPFSRRDLAIV
jgi:hypothetical protein